MIHLEHLNLIVANIETSLKFYRAAFPEWKIRGGGEQDWYGKQRNWIHFGDDYHYLALCDSGTGENRDLTGHQIGLAHFAYVTGDIKGVTERLQKAGFSIANDGAEQYKKNVYFIDPDGYEIEFVEYLSDLPSQRNSYES